MSWLRRSVALVRPVGLALLPFVTVAAACGGGGEAAPGAGGFPAMAVKVVTLAEKPIAQTSEYIATLRSMRSTTIMPLADGLVTRIFVVSGARVKPGQPILQLEADKEQAALRSLEARRAALVAEVAFSRQQAERATALVSQGAISKQEAEEAQTRVETGEAQIKALDAQIREQRVQVGYFQVTAPVAGVIGDIAVRVGERVTTSTDITTIDQSSGPGGSAGRGSGLEAHIPVPLERATDLRLGLPVEFLDGTGAVVATNPITFLSPRVDEATQTVLVKSLLKDLPPTMRVQQYVRVRIVWASSPGLSVPVVAVTRLSGQHFAFVAEPKENGFVARQRPIKVGDIVGDDYVVLGGLKRGERLIVSGIQKLGDGVPVKPEA
jgi:RND family efflux transporter MFP subunit